MVSIGEHQMAIRLCINNLSTRNNLGACIARGLLETCM
tara:strand:+ start:13924 stop:14037 length:114 start_codon:yes stop_codon:yes gene_type:complete